MAARIRLCICAKDLPKTCESYASLAFSGSGEVYRTEISNDSSNPEWEKIVFVETNGEGVISIDIKTSDDEHIGGAELGLETLLGGSHGNVAAATMEGGGIIFVYADPGPVEGSLLLQICGEDLTNTEGFLSRSKSDPFFEVEGVGSNTVVYKSEVIRENLNPVWEKAEMQLEALCGGDLVDKLIKFTVFDQDPDKRDLMGTFEASVSALLSTQGGSFTLMKRGRKSGKISFLLAALHNYTDLRETARVAINAKAAALNDEAALVNANVDLERKTVTAEEESARAAELNKKAEGARVVADEKALEAEAALEQSTMAEAAAADAKNSSTKAADRASELKKAPPSGVLSFKFVGEKLKNVEGLGILRKSDPFFVLQRKQSSWTSVHTSDVVKNNLNPSWSEGEVELSSLVSGDFNEPLHLVVFDKERNNKHELMGSFETSIAELLSMHKAGLSASLSKGGVETGWIRSSKLELRGYVDPKEAEEEARILADKADLARFFALGKKAAEKVASDAAEEARSDANDLTLEAEEAAREAESARMAAKDAGSAFASIGVDGLTL